MNEEVVLSAGAPVSRSGRSELAFVDDGHHGRTGTRMVCFCLWVVSTAACHPEVWSLKSILSRRQIQR